MKMPGYRGIDKEALILSLQAGEAFLRGLNLGPATERLLDKRFTKGFYADLAAATDDASLTRAMLQIQRDPPFVQNMLVFYYHAILDTDGIGKKVYDGLNAWGAFFGTMTGPMSADALQSIAERKTHITRLHFNRAEELRNGNNIPHPSQDMRDFRALGKPNGPQL